MPKSFLLLLSPEISGNAFSSRKRAVHEEVPNTNIKIICPLFRKKMLYAEGCWFMNFGPTPTSSLFIVRVKSGEVRIEGKPAFMNSPPTPTSSFVDFSFF
jgi:hypothetical protein